MQILMISSPHLARIRADYRGMTPSYRGIAEYVLEHPYELVFTSAARLGALARSSGATVVRFSESLGLTGYAHLQRLAREAVHRHADTLSKLENTQELTRSGTIPESTITADIANLERTRTGISEAAFQRAVDLMNRASRRSCRRVAEQLRACASSFFQPQHDRATRGLHDPRHRGSARAAHQGR